MPLNRLWPADLAPQALAGGLRPLSARRPRLLLRSSVGSTNDVAADSASPQGTLVVADAQRRGRGRRGRRWASPAGTHLYWSIAMPKGEWRQPPGWLPLLGGLAVMRVLEGLGARGLQLKWPNDVQDRQGRKLAGQLVEGRGGYWILGAGINIRSGPVDNSVGLEGLGLPGVGRGRLAGLLGHEFLKAWHEPGARFPQGLLAAWEERARLGEAVTVYPAKGPSWSGIALGINEQGGLRVQAPEGEVHLKGEECSIRPEGGS